MPAANRYPLLFQVDSPADLRRLDEHQLPALCKELRQYLIESVAKTGGHLGSSLGTVELTVALHAAYNTPHDRIVWDVGHQGYPHKILTGRRDRMHTMRKKDGLAGFPNRAESDYDAFGVGHSSTSISAALGMAEAARVSGVSRKVAAVIGDGAITAGLAYEALNNAGHWKSDMLVVLNDNDMSISPNVGALNQSLTRVLSGRPFIDARAGGKRVLKKLPGPLAEIARRAEEHVKGMVAPGTLFEELGFTYYGPVDGHDVQSLLPVLRNLREVSGPVLLHVITKKGKGYSYAEQDALALHAVTPFNPETGKPLKSGSNTTTYTQVFSEWLCDMAAQDPKLVGITPAMREGSGLVEFQKRFPDRYFDVAIAEQQSVTFAAGLACEGMKPVVAIYSSFLQRAYDQMVHDVALQNLDVTFAIDRAGVVGPDGPTHAGAYDFSFMRCIPNMVVMAPRDENECRQMLYTAHQHVGPASVRYPRGGGSGSHIEDTMTALPIGKAEVLHRGKGAALLAFGSLVEDARIIGEELGLTVVNMRFVKPIDDELIASMAKDHSCLVTLEENAVMGGAGSAVCESLNAAGISKPVLQIGLPDSYLEHGSREELLAAAELDIDSLRRRIKRYLQSQVTSTSTAATDSVA